MTNMNIDNNPVQKNTFYKPHLSHLKNIIHSIWQVDGMSTFHKEYIIPKGVVEIIFNFNDYENIPAQLGSRNYHLPRCFINGFNKTPIQLDLPQKMMLLGIRFQPLAVENLLRIQPCEFTDTITDLGLIDPDFNDLWHQLFEQPDFDTRIALFCAWLTQKNIDLRPQAKMTNYFLTTVKQHDLSVKQLADLLCYSPRHLSRKMFEATGMNTEEILLYKKYLHALHLIHHSDLSLAEIAYQSGFSDQSHFIRSFKSYTTMTPGAYSKNKGMLSGHFYQNVR